MTIPFDKYEKFGAYHWGWYEQKPRYKAHVDRCKEWIKEKDVLDIGAGDGLIASHIGAVGIEIDETAVRLARQQGVNVICGSAYQLPFADNEFEAVFIGDTLEHLEFPLKALDEARRVLKKTLYVSGPVPGGVLEAYEYADSKWSLPEIKKNIEELGFRLEGEIEVSGRKRHETFYAKFIKA